MRKDFIAIILMLILSICGCAKQSTVITDPPQADVYVNKRFIGKSPAYFDYRALRDMDVSAVKGECKGSRFFASEKKGIVDVTVSQMKREAVVPNEIYLVLDCPSTIITNPPKADVYVNKNHIGKSPVSLKGNITEETEIVASTGEFKASKIFRVNEKQPSDKTSPPKGVSAFLPGEVHLTLNGKIEVGAFRVGTEEEKGELETAMEVLYKLKNPSNTVVVYDASGSMRWPLNEADKTPRFEPGQRAIIDFIRKANPEDFFGLIIFGHRIPSGAEGSRQRLNSCRDIELVIPPQKLEKNTMVDVIENLTLKDHKGDTPLEDAIRRGIEVLKERAGEKKIVVVTDGDDECDGRPDRAAKEAARYGIKVHTLAFGIGISKEGRRREQKALETQEILKECANAGGGLFFDTKGAEELYRAIIKVELAVFTFTVKDTSGKEVLKGSLGQKFFLDPGQYEIVFNTDKPFSNRIEVKPAKNTKIFIALSRGGQPEIRTVFE